MPLCSFPKPSGPDFGPVISWQCSLSQDRPIGPVREIVYQPPEMQVLQSVLVSRTYNFISKLSYPIVL
jgi:hypothetical protein